MFVVIDNIRIIGIANHFDKIQETVYPQGNIKQEISEIDYDKITRESNHDRETDFFVLFIASRTANFLVLVAKSRV